MGFDGGLLDSQQREYVTSEVNPHDSTVTGRAFGKTR